MQQKFEEAARPLFFCAELFSNVDLKSKKGNQTIHLQSTTQAKTIIVRRTGACNPLCVYAACVVGLISTIEIKKLIVVKVQSFQQETSRTCHTEKYLTGLGNRMRDNEGRKTVAPVSQEAGFSAEVGKRPILRDPARTHTRDNHRVIKERRPLLTKQQ